MEKIERRQVLRREVRCVDWTLQKWRKRGREKYAFRLQKKIIDQNKTRLRQAIKFVEFCGRHERISKKQEGSLVGRTPSFRGENSQLFIHKLFDFLEYSNHKQFFLFKAFASITSAPPLEKSWLRPWTPHKKRNSFLTAWLWLSSVVK